MLAVLGHRLFEASANARSNDLTIACALQEIALPAILAPTGVGAAPHARPAITAPAVDDRVYLIRVGTPGTIGAPAAG
jgi:hypothetical protein